MTITIWIWLPAEGTRRFIFDLPPDACALVEVGLRTINSFSPHHDYIQFMYNIGGYGGIPMIFEACI